MFVSQYGWFLLLGAVLLVWLWYKMRPHYSSWRRERERQQEERNFGERKELYTFLLVNCFPATSPSLLLPMILSCFIITFLFLLIVLLLVSQTL